MNKEIKKRASELYESGIDSRAEISRIIMKEMNLDNFHWVRNIVQRKLGKKQRLFVKKTTSSESQDKKLWDIKNDSATFEYTGRRSITTLAEAIDFCDADMSFWDVDRYTFNSWDVTTKEGTTHTNYQVKVYFIKKSSKSITPVAEFNEYLGLVREDISNSFEWANVKKHTKTTDGCLFVPCIFDLHLGKLAWKEESGEDYDLKIAEERFVKAIEDLIKKSSGNNIERILFPIGNDIYNSDRALPYAQTTAGTPQQDDSRWQKMFKTGVRLITWAVHRLSEIAPVDVVTVFSNHDFERVFYLGEVISAVFERHSNVRVDNSPLVRKYYKYGKCLFGLAHGHNEKPSDLPLLMAQESKEMWSETHYREWLLGHLHHSKKMLTEGSRDYNGIKVTYMTSPSSTDAWHFSRGYVGSVKGAEAFIYDKKQGLIGSAVHNIF